MKRIKISQTLSRRIQEMKASGASITMISKRLKLSRSTVSWHVIQHRKNPRFEVRPSARPRSTTPRKDKLIFLTVKRDRFETQKATAAMFNISVRTLKRRLSTHGIAKRRALKDDMSRKQKANRVNWCRRNRHTNFDKWLFTDESSFELAQLSLPRGKRVYRSSKDKYKPACVIHGGVRIRQSIMVWGMISRSGPVAFRILHGTINSQRYIQTLNDELLPYLEGLPLNELRLVVFQHDNAPPHRAVRTRNFLAQNGIETAVWPPLSPDLNPIEFVWAAMKERIAQHRPTTLLALRREIMSAWTAVTTPEFCRKIYDRLPAALATVINHKGLH